MNPDNGMDKHFILIQRRYRIENKRQIYTPKYFSLMLTMTILGGILQIQTDMNGKGIFEYVIQILAIIIAFLISSFSQIIGHRRSFIISFIIHSMLFIVIFSFGSFKLSWVLMEASRLLLLSQIIIQIYGMWPLKYARIFAELYYFMIIIRQAIISITNNYTLIESVICWVLIALILVNTIWLFCWSPIFMSINDFKSPETDSVWKDFWRLLLNVKIFIFTLLRISCMLSIYLMFFFLNSDLTQIFKTQQIISLINLQLFLTILVIILALVIVNLNLRPSLNIFLSLILLVSSLIIKLIQIQVGNFKYAPLFVYILQYCLLLFIILLQDVFMTPQYGQILLNIGIRNLDFVSSFQLLVYGQAQMLDYLLLENDNQFSQYLIKNSWILILSLMAIIMTLAFIFYQILGFKVYIKNTNTSQVEEDKFQIEIV